MSRTNDLNLDCANAGYLCLPGGVQLPKKRADVCLRNVTRSDDQYNHFDTFVTIATD